MQSVLLFTSVVLHIKVLLASIIFLKSQLFNVQRQITLLHNSGIYAVYMYVDVLLFETYILAIILRGSTSQPVTAFVRFFVVVILRFESYIDW